MDRGRAAIILSTALTVACAGEAVPEESPDGEATGYILLDRAARDAGWTLEGLEEADLSLPVAVEPGEAISVVGEGRHHGPSLRVEVEPGEVVVVREADLGTGEKALRRTIGRDVASDKIIALGTEEAAQMLADDVGGELVSDEDGRFVIEVADVYHELSNVAAPEGLDEVRPAPRDVDERWSEALPDQSAPSILPHARAAAAAESLLHASSGGVGAANADATLLSALDAPPLECGDAIEGTWVSRSFSENYADWYIFSLHIGKDPANPGKLTGQIDARSWSGSADDDKPMECADIPHNTWWGSGFDWTVEMAASGELADKTLRFGGQSWAPKAERCGQAPSEGQYNLDHFAGRVVEGRFIQALQNDGGRAIDEPHVFRRVSCSR